MAKLPSAGSQSPSEIPAKTLDELLNDDVRDAIDQVDVVEDDSAEDSIVDFIKDFGKQFLIALMVTGTIAIIGFSVSYIQASDSPQSLPEINIGVDPNPDVDRSTAKSNLRPAE